VEKGGGGVSRSCTVVGMMIFIDEQSDLRLFLSLIYI
jgi:hypothetical protein